MRGFGRAVDPHYRNRRALLPATSLIHGVPFGAVRQMDAELWRPLHRYVLGIRTALQAVLP